MNQAGLHDGQNSNCASFLIIFIFCTYKSLFKILLNRENLRPELGSLSTSRLVIIVNDGQILRGTTVRDQINLTLTSVSDIRRIELSQITPFQQNYPGTVVSTGTRYLINDFLGGIDRFGDGNIVVLGVTGEFNLESTGVLDLEVDELVEIAFLVVQGVVGAVGAFEWKGSNVFVQRVQKFDPAEIWSFFKMLRLIQGQIPYEKKV